VVGLKKRRSGYGLEISLRFWEVFRRHLMVFNKYWHSNVMFYFLEPLLYLLALGIGLGIYITEVEGLSYLEFIAPGILASSAMWATTFECSYNSFIRLEVQKTYHAIVTTPVSLDEIVLGDIVFGAFKSFFYGSIFLLVLFFLGYVSSPLALLVPAVLVLTGLVFAQLSMIWTSVAPNMELFSYYFTLFITPMFLFSGIFFPVENMPLLVRRLAWLTPLYHSVELCRGLITGRVDALHWANLSVLLLLSLLLFYPPLFLMRRRLIK